MAGFSPDELETLAGVFSTAVSATRALAAVGVPRHRMPIWGADSSLGFWSEVSALAAAGAIPDGHDRLLRLAAEWSPVGSALVLQPASRGPVAQPRPRRGREVPRDGSRVYRIGRSQVTVTYGDITEIAPEVIVSSDDALLSMGGGVSYAIRRRAGRALEDDVSKVGSRRLGDVVVTTAGALPSRYVFHAITIGPEGQPATGATIRQAVRSCLERMELLGVSSIAFPVLASGAAYVSVEESASSMAEALCEYLPTAGALDVTIVLYLDERRDAHEFVRLYEELSRRATPVWGMADGCPRPGNALDRAPGPVPATSPDLERERQELETIIVRRRLAGHDYADIEDRLRANLELRLSAELDERRRVDSSVSVFISYAHEDDALRAELTKHLANLRRNQIIREWHDRKILPGRQWANEIDDQLAESQIILFLLSPDFMASDYCVGVEAVRASELHHEGRAVLIPVVLRPVDWDGSLFSQFLALPTDARPITDWKNQDSAFVDVVRGISQAARALRRDRASS